MDCSRLTDCVSTNITQPFNHKQDTATEMTDQVLSGREQKFPP
jgi:hypothetical protein